MASKLAAGHAVWFKKLDDVSSALDRETLQHAGILSSVLFPLRANTADDTGLTVLVFTSSTEPGEWSPSLFERLRLVAVLAKAEASHDGLLRGHRHTMLDDSDISSTRHARAFVAGALGGLIGHAEIYVSGGAEHQGPDGGGPVALIVTRPV